MIKPILLLLLVIILSNTILAYVKPEYYEGVQIKFYDEVNKTECYEMFGSVPDEYYEKLNYIKIYDEDARRANGKYYYASFETIMGLYFLNSGIVLYNGCTRSTFIHELAHHCQIRRGDTFYLALNHIGNFEPCMKEIRGRIR